MDQAVQVDGEPARGHVSEDTDNNDLTGHSHSHAHDVGANNAHHFDDVARKYDDIPGAQELARRVGIAMRSVYPFDEDETTVLDFACGTGLVSRALAPYAKMLLGVDISQGMVDEYNRRVANQGIAPEEMRAVRAELTGAEGELNGLRFDVVVCSMAYHHFASYKDMTRVLAYFLKPGGSILVVDIMKDDAGTEVIPQQFHHVVPHTAGISESEMRDAFEGAALEDFVFEKAGMAKRPDRVGQLGTSFNFFIAKGTKPQ
ncbi:S-adenosyl-L-methionine-dependent methyltransferase, partial [Artomyces pyxidatus]